MDEKNVKKVAEDKKISALKEVGERFHISRTVNHLQDMMEQVTKDKVDVFTVNAACNCVQNLNNTIRTAVMAARFLANVKGKDDDEEV